MTDVLDKGFVRLDGVMADDLSVVNAARVSFAQSSEVLAERDEGLIRFLMRERHGTPFEHNAFRFHIKCPIFVAREWMRHRIGSFNEMSGRYTKLEAEFYVPEFVRTQVGKPGSYTFEPVDERTKEDFLSTASYTYGNAWRAYEAMLERGVAKELARLFLPVGVYTQFYWTVNARSLMNFLSLRTHETAMFEIRQFADAVEEIFATQMPVTHEAWVANDKVAP